MDEKYVWALAAFAVGLLMARNAGQQPQDNTAHNEVQTKGDWWTFAGAWQAA